MNKNKGNYSGIYTKNNHGIACANYYTHCFCFNKSLTLKMSL